MEFDANRIDHLLSQNGRKISPAKVDFLRIGKSETQKLFSEKVIQNQLAKKITPNAAFLINS